MTESSSHEAAQSEAIVFCEFLTSINYNRQEAFSFSPMTDLDSKLRCERVIADLTVRIAQLKGSGRGSEVLASAAFIDLLQQTLDGWEDRKKSLAEPLSDSH